MSIKVEKFLNKDTEHWDSFVKYSNNGTIFHFRSFLNYHENISFQDHSLIFYKNNKIIALLPATLNNNIFHSHPGISFGSFIYNKYLSFADSKEIVDVFLNYISKINCSHINITLPPSCYSQVPSDYIEFCLFYSGFQYKKLDLSNIINLNTNFNTVYESYKPSARQAARKAKKSGVMVEQSDSFSEFYQILENNLSLRHNVSPVHSLSELQKLKQLFSSRINLFTAHYDNQMIAGVINFICNDNTILAFYISHKMEFQHLRPLNCLFGKIFEWAINNNYRYYDFGLFTINGEANLSLARFKESFGSAGIFRKTMSLD